MSQDNFGILDRVRVQRWPDQYTVMGPAVLVRDIDSVANDLVRSGFMREWLTERVKEALRSGHVFTHVKSDVREDDGVWRGRDDRVVAEYRIASQDEVVKYVDSQEYQEVTGRAPRKIQEKGYVLHYQDSPDLVEKYAKLPRQARVIMDLLNAANRETLTEAAIEVILDQGKEELKTKQEPRLVFGFYRKKFVESGFLEEVGK